MISKKHNCFNEITTLFNQITNELKELKSFQRFIEDILKQNVITPRDLELVEFINDRVEYPKYLTRCISQFQKYKEIEQRYPAQSFTKERTYVRDISYSLWHRSLNKDCFALDLDFLEMRKDKGIWAPRLLYDVKYGLYDISKLESWNHGYLNTISVYKTVADYLNIPFYVISCIDNFTNFKLYEIKQCEPLEYSARSLSEPELRKFLEKL